jgi:hypothetical protein
VFPALAAALALAATPTLAAGGDSPVTAGVAVGAGWDTTLARDPASAILAPAGSVGWRANAGWFLEPGESDALLLEVTYSGLRYDDPTLPGSHRPGAGAVWARLLRDRLRLRASTSAAWLASDDPARRGVEAGAAASIGLVVAKALQLRVGVGGFRMEAATAAWSNHLERVRASAVVTPWRGAAVILGYAWQTGTDTVYATTSAATAALGLAGSGAGSGSGAGTGAGTGTGTTAGSGTGTTGTTAGTATGTVAGAGTGASGPDLPAISTAPEAVPLAPVRIPASAHVLSVDVEHALGGGVFLAAGWSLSLGSTPSSPWNGQQALVEIGWRR